MNRFSDAALLRGKYATMLKKSPGDSDWARETECTNMAERAAEELAKQIFHIRDQIDEKRERLQVTTLSAMGPVSVSMIVPTQSELLRIEGHLTNGEPVIMVQHAHQLSVSVTKAPLKTDQDEDDDGLEIGFVIFEELKKRKTERTNKAKKSPSKKAAKK